MADVPVIDIAPLLSGSPGCTEVADRLHGACRDVGFFYVVGHGVDPGLFERLDSLARRFFACPTADKERIAMSRGGTAWRGWFPVGGELTSGVPDHKEGMYFGSELPRADRRVRRGLPLHGPNLFPAFLPEMRPAVLEYMERLTAVGQAVLRGLGIGLGLGPEWFVQHLTADPLVLFRIFRYPPLPGRGEEWSVGEHTDYGLLTVLWQDEKGGLEVRTSDGWVDAPPVSSSLLCNLGDMMERLTRGFYRSTLHRVQHHGTGDRLSFPFFLDPSWEARIEPLSLRSQADDGAGSRWDGESVHRAIGTYGDYIVAKVARVFPDLAQSAAGLTRVRDASPTLPSHDES